MSIGAFLQAWGPVALFAVMLAEQLGLPLPTLPVMMVAGAIAHESGGWGLREIAVATLASFIGGLLWFQVGRHYGYDILHRLCRISISADTCVRQTEVSFEKAGARALIVARFVPGLSLLAPPLAGGLGMPLRTFSVYHGTAALLYALVGVGGGVLFYDQMHIVLEWMNTHARHALVLVAILLAAWLVRRIWLRRSLRLAPDVLRMTALELSQALVSAAPPLVLDVRARRVRERDPDTVPGAQPFDLDDAGALALLPEDRVIVTFCNCPNDASAIELARRITRSGRRSVRVLAGGLDGWRERETVVVPASVNTGL